MVYAREIEGETHDFGVLGVQEDSLVLYDNKTRSQWSQLGGDAIEGTHKGKRLKTVPSLLTSWKHWRKLHPGTSVYVRALFPYRSRFTAQEIGRFAKQESGTVDAADLILAVRGSNGTIRAYSLTLLAEKGLMNEDVEGFPVLLHYNESGDTVQVVSRMVEGRLLTFKLSDEGGLYDVETGSKWDSETMTAVSGELAGLQLQIVPFNFSRWSAWQQYRPDTLLVTGE